MNSELDRPGTVRAEDQPDLHKLYEYLNPLLGLKSADISIKQFKGGASNLTFLIQSAEDQFILRTSPIGAKIASAHDMLREFTIQQKLAGHLPVPKMYHYCGDTTVIGRPFYVMEKLTGIIPRKNLPKNWVNNPGLTTLLCKSYTDLLINIHELDYQQAGLEDLYKGAGYVQRQVSGWTKRMIQAQTPDVPTFEPIMLWLDDNQPNDLKPTLIHNDFRFDNLVFDPNHNGKIIGILDWEMATIGDPLMELGNSLAYWIQTNDPMALKMLRRQPTHEKGMFTRDHLVSYYLSQRNLPNQPFLFYYVFGLFRLSVIIQQIYFRYYHRQSTNKRFAIFGIANQLLFDIIKNLIAGKKSSLHHLPLSQRKNLKYSIALALKSLK